MVENLPDNAEDTRDAGLFPKSGKNPQSRKWLPHPSILAWKVPWTEEPGGLQSTGLQRVGHDGHEHTQDRHIERMIGSLML